MPNYNTLPINRIQINNNRPVNGWSSLSTLERILLDYLISRWQPLFISTERNPDNSQLQRSLPSFWDPTASRQLLSSSGMIGDKLSGPTLSHRSIVLSSRTISSDYVDKFVLITKWSWHSVWSNFQGNYKAALPPIPIMIKARCGMAARISNWRRQGRRCGKGGPRRREQKLRTTSHRGRSRGRGRWWSPQMGRDPHFRSWTLEPRTVDWLSDQQTDRGAQTLGKLPGGRSNRSRVFVNLFYLRPGQQHYNHHQQPRQKKRTTDDDGFII